MKTQKLVKITCTFLLFTLVPFISIAQRVRPKSIRWDIPGVPKPLKNREVSGKSILNLPVVNGQKEVIYWFSDRPFSLGQSFVDSTDSRKLAASILGRVVSMDMKSPYLESPSPCATGIISPFNVSDVQRSAEYGTGYKFTIKQSKVRSLNTSMNIETDIQNLIGEQKLSRVLIDSLRAALTTGYARLNDTDVKIIGVYEVYMLSDDVLNKLGRPGMQYFSDCQTYYNNRKSKGINEGLITSIGFVTYNVEYSQDIVNSLAFNIKGLLTRQGLNINPKFVIDNRVKTNLDASINRGYQVLVWKKVPLDALERP